jgi:hypothetical protein
MVPEEIVHDEDVLPHRLEVVGDRADPPLPEASSVELPDRAEAAAKRASPRRLDEPYRLEFVGADLGYGFASPLNVRAAA